VHGPSIERSSVCGTYPAPVAEIVGRRLMAYLRLLPMAEARRLELALDILCRTETESMTEAQALGQAMALLRDRLGGRDCLPVADVPPCLPLLRGHMIPEEMDRRPWLSTAMRWGQAYADLCRRRPLFRPGLLLSMLLTALALLLGTASSLQ